MTPETMTHNDSRLASIVAYCWANKPELVSAALDWAEDKRREDCPVDIVNTLTNACQVFDGWHNDGTAWSEWDESVRQDMAKLLAFLSAKRNKERA